jgi:hypothetical protein
MAVGTSMGSADDGAAAGCSLSLSGTSFFSVLSGFSIFDDFVGCSGVCDFCSCCRAGFWVCLGPAVCAVALALDADGLATVDLPCESPCTETLLLTCLSLFVATSPPPFGADCWFPMMSESRRGSGNWRERGCAVCLSVGWSSAYPLRVQIAREVSRIWNVHKARWFCTAGTLEGVHRKDHMITVVEDEDQK